MPFSEPLKLSIRRAAHFRCCICRSVGVEIHHIIPQESGGADTPENAAPLCPSCHELYGANPTKRKFIREARDYWFEVCSQTTTTAGLTINDLSRELQAVASKQDIAELRQLIVEATAKAQLVSTSPTCNQEGFIPVPLERFINSLYEEDYGSTPSMYEMLFDSRMWYEERDSSYERIDRRAQFLKDYGEQTAHRVCLKACRDADCNPKGFTEDDLVRAIKCVIAIVILVTGHESHTKFADGFQCAQLQDGEFLWRVAPRESRTVSTKTKRKTAKSAKLGSRSSSAV